MAEVNYKTKYIELKAKFISAIDVAFRLGVEQGMQQAQVQQAQQQQADAQAMQQAALQGQGQPGEEGGAPGEEGGQPGQEQPGQPVSEHPEGSELDQHIAGLEQAMGKAEYGTELWESLNKSLEGIKSVKAGYEHAAMLRKNEHAIRSIAKNMNKAKLAPVRKLNDRARKNLTDHQKSTLDLQQKIVDDVFKHWDAEESDMMGKVLEIVGSEGKLKKE